VHFASPTGHVNKAELNLIHDTFDDSYNDSNVVVDHLDDAMWLGDSYVLSECYKDYR